MTEFDPSQPMTPEMEGMIAMKYESESAESKSMGKTPSQNVFMVK